MKPNTTALFAAACLAVANLAVAADKDEIVLFNGKSFDDWTAVLSIPGLKLEDIWSVAPGGVLVCKGNRPDKVRGYIRTTRDDFHDYTLTLQWRFPAGTPGGNSGVLVHASTPNALGVWPKSMEAQLNHKNAGDIWVIGTTCEIENADKRVAGRRHFNLTDDSERPIGEWNDYKIVCDGDQITIWVNDDLVNHVTKCSVSTGAICLQAEGADVEFRNIRLKPLPK